MTPKLRKAFCPQCGSGDCVRTAGENQFLCQSCGTQFGVNLINGNPQVRIVDTQVKARQQLASLKWIAVLLVVMAAAAITTPLLRKVRAPASAEKRSENLGRPEDSALFENSGSFSFIQLFSDRTDQQSIYHTVITDMQTGKRLSEPQEFRFPKTTESKEFRYLSDGNLYLILMNRWVYRFDPGAMRFVDITPQLTETFPQQLGVGLSKVGFTYRSREGFSVTSADGTDYRIYWFSGQILNDRGEGLNYAKAARSYTQQRVEWRLLPVKSDSIRNARYVLAQTWNRWEPGQMYRTDYVELIPENSEDVQSDLRGYGKVGGGFRVKPYVFDDGLIRLETLDAQTPRFNAQVLAQNEQRLLFYYTPTPDETQGQVFQILDKTSRKIIWSRTRDQIAPLASVTGRWYGFAMGLPSGFYIKVDRPGYGFLMGNDGSIVHDFPPPDFR